MTKDNKTHKQKAKESYSNLNQGLFFTAFSPSYVAAAVAASRMPKGAGAEGPQIAAALCAYVLALPLCLVTAPIAGLIYLVGKLLEPAILAGAKLLDDSNEDKSTNGFCHK